LDGKDFEWSDSEETYLNQEGKTKKPLMLEEYARPELGNYEEDSGLLELDFKKVLIDNNRKIKEFKEELELFGGLNWVKAIEHNIQRKKFIDKVPDLLDTWELEMIGPQPYSSVTKFTAEKDIERHHLPDNMIAGPNFDLGEWLYPIKAGEECWLIETYGKPFYYCPESKVKKGCKETFEGISFPSSENRWLNKWQLTCEHPP